MKARNERCVLAAVPGDLEERSLTHGRVGIQRSQGSVGSHLIHEHQSLRIDAAQFHAPSAPQELVSFCCPSGSFFRVCEIRRSVRHTVASLTETPEMANRNSALWEWVAHGLCWRSSTRSFLAFSSSFGALPGAFLGSRVPRSSSCLQ